MNVRCLRCNDGAELFPGETCSACGGASDIPSQTDAPTTHAVSAGGVPSRDGRHKVKLATKVKRGRVEFWVWECVCGLSSPLYSSAHLANEAYAAHKAADDKIEAA